MTSVKVLQVSTIQPGDTLLEALLQLNGYLLIQLGRGDMPFLAGERLHKAMVRTNEECKFFSFVQKNFPELINSFPILEMFYVLWGYKAVKQNTLENKTELDKLSESIARAWDQTRSVKILETDRFNSSSSEDLPRGVFLVVFSEDKNALLLYPAHKTPIQLPHWLAQREIRADRIFILKSEHGDVTINIHNPNQKP